MASTPSLSPLAPTARRARVASPWGSGGLEQIVLGDLFGVENQPVTRAEAVTVPAITNARWLICTPLARHPLRAYRGETLAADQPAWLYRTNGTQAPQMRILWTLDDLLFTGYAVWSVTRGQRGQITDAERLPPDWWDFDEAWRIVLKVPGHDERLARADEVILFTSPMDPLLDAAARTIRAARNIEDAWAARVKDPVPTTLIRQTEDIELEEGSEEEDEAQALVDEYVKARRKTTGAVVFVPYGYTVEPYGTVTPELFIQGRNAVVLDVARFTALPPTVLGASPTNASLTYTTQEGGRTEFVDYSLAGWAMAIEARLSMDDVVPQGMSVKFDLEWLTTFPTPSTGPTVED